MSSKRQKIQKPLGVSNDESAYLMRAGEEFAPTYLIGDDIEILTIKGKIAPLCATAKAKGGARSSFLGTII